MTQKEVLDIAKNSEMAEIQHVPLTGYTVLTGLDGNNKAFYHALSLVQFDSLRRKVLIVNRTQKEHNNIQIWHFV